MYKYKILIILIIIVIGIGGYFWLIPRNAHFSCAIENNPIESSNMSEEWNSIYKSNTGSLGIHYQVVIKNIGGRAAENFLPQFVFSEKLQKLVVNQDIFNIPIRFINPTKDFNFGGDVIFKNIKTAPTEGVNILLTWKEGEKNRSQLCNSSGQ